MLAEARKELSEVQNLELDAFLISTVGDFVQAECQFLDLVFEMGDQQGMTLGDAREFIRYLGELRLYQLGILCSEEVRENPLEWIDYILTGSTHTNFFESRIADYTHQGLEGKVDYKKYLKFLTK